ncbi:MAG TPA: cupredoxin domain-containing protein [Solirubrobacterales bacterium]|nr:cupredoxin domain-containing protein [Solirubrobacterales bacterium]
MNETLFYVFGIALVVSAVATSVIGLRFETFPPNRAVLGGVVLYFAVLVGATAAFAIQNAQDEQAAQEAEQAAETTTTTTTGAGATTTTPSEGGGGGGTTVKLAADPSDIAYTTDSLSAKAGSLTIDFDNPNPAIPHDVCIDSQSGSALGCSDEVTNASTTLALKNLKPGKYTFFCDVDAHEEAGMKGTLTVQ